MFKIAPKSETFKANVVFRELDDAGRSVTHTLGMTLRRLTQKALQAAIDAHPFPKDEDGNAIRISAEEALDITARQVQELAVDWDVAAPDGQPLLFTHDNIVAVLDSYPSLFSAIMETCGAAHRGEVRRKN